MMDSMVSCPRCGRHLGGAARCPECGVPGVDDAHRETAGAGPFVLAATLLDPFEGRHLAELLETRRIPTRLRRRGHTGWPLHLHGPRWGELLVPEAHLAEARSLVAVLRANLAAGDVLAEHLALTGRPARDVEPIRGPLRACTGGGPPVVSPFGRFGWIEVAGGRLGPGGHLEGRLSTGSRLARSVELVLVPEAPAACPEDGAGALARQRLDLPEAATVAFTLRIPGADPRGGSHGYRLEARILGRRQVLATGTLHLRCRPTLLAMPVRGRA